LTYAKRFSVIRPKGWTTQTARAPLPPPSDVIAGLDYSSQRHESWCRGLHPTDEVALTYQATSAPQDTAPSSAPQISVRSYYYFTPRRLLPHTLFLPLSLSLSLSLRSPILSRCRFVLCRPRAAPPLAHTTCAPPPFAAYQALPGPLVAAFSVRRAPRAPAPRATLHSSRGEH
jgi:hypothetical protein